MDELVARIIELRTARDTAHAEICELEKRLELLAEVADTPAEKPVRDMFKEKDRVRAEGAEPKGRGK